MCSSATSCCSSTSPCSSQVPSMAEMLIGDMDDLEERANIRMDLLENRIRDLERTLSEMLWAEARIKALGK